MNKTVLVVDDDDLVRHGLVGSLKEKGLNVIEAVNGKLGLEMALANKPDLVITDIMMPEMDGLAMVESLRKDSWGHDVPVIILTTDETTTSINEALQNGVAVYLPKTTLQPAELTRQVMVALG